MNLKKLICLLLALALAGTCLTGCRGSKEDPAASVGEQDTSAVEAPEEPHEVQVVDTLPEIQGGLEDEGALVIEVTAGSEIGGD